MLLGERVRTRRRELGWTQDELAQRLDVRQNVISRLEAGTVHTPNLKMLRRLAKTLQVTSDWLIGMYDPDIDEKPTLVSSAS